jgi:hypothetical protein
MKEGDGEEEVRVKRIRRERLWMWIWMWMWVWVWERKTHAQRGFDPLLNNAPLHNRATLTTAKDAQYLVNILLGPASRHAASH